MERLCAHRSRPTPDLGIGGLVERIERTTRQRSAAEAEASRAWREVYTDPLEDDPAGDQRLDVVQLRSRVLTVRASDHGVRWRAEEWLRAGGLSALQAEARTAIVRVKVIV